MFLVADRWFIFLSCKSLGRMCSIYFFFLCVLFCFVKYILTYWLQFVWLLFLMQQSNYTTVHLITVYNRNGQVLIWTLIVYWSDWAFSSHEPAVGFTPCLYECVHMCAFIVSVWVCACVCVHAHLCCGVCFLTNNQSVAAADAAGRKND